MSYATKLILTISILSKSSFSFVYITPEIKILMCNNNDIK